MLQEQSGVFRVNCLDSIDRTNVAQSHIGITVFQICLKACGVDIDKHFGEGTTKAGIAFSTIDHPLINDLKFHWRDKGDILSRQYTGTDSTISKVSQDGKEGLWGKLNHKMTVVQRTLKNTIFENSDQEPIDTILGKHGHLQLDFNSSAQE